MSNVWKRPVRERWDFDEDPAFAHCEYLEQFAQQYRAALYSPRGLEILRQQAASRQNELVPLLGTA